MFRIRTEPSWGTKALRVPHGRKSTCHGLASSNVGFLSSGTCASHDMAVPWQRLWSTGFVWVFNGYCNINKRFVSGKRCLRSRRKTKKRIIRSRVEKPLVTTRFQGGTQVKDASGGPAGSQPFKKVAKQVLKKRVNLKPKANVLWPEQRRTKRICNPLSMRQPG